MLGSSSAGTTRFLGASTEILIQHPTGRRHQQLLHATIGYVGLPKPGKNGEAFVRADLPDCKEGPKALFLSGGAPSAVYLLRWRRRAVSLPASPRAAYRNARSAPLRLADAFARTPGKRLEGPGPSLRRTSLQRSGTRRSQKLLRRALQERRCRAVVSVQGQEFGSILVDGHLSEDEDAFFAGRILAYKPEMTSRKVTLLLRRCEFFADRVVCRDPRRKLEVWLDSNVLPGLGWDLTWNHWKHWLRTRIEVDATFVHAGKYRLYNGEWILRKWQAALPSRLQVHASSNVPEDLQHAQTIHALLGEHADLVQHIRNQCEKIPIEHAQVERWFDQVNASAHLKPHHVTWCPDYEPYYFDQLRKRSRTWFLFRNEYLFVWRNVLIAEIPEPGHATYLFAKPENQDDFLDRYATLTREDIRHNRGNLATLLGFVGRVVRGKRKKRWLADVLKQAGQRADYIEAFD